MIFDEAIPSVDSNVAKHNKMHGVIDPLYAPPYIQRITKLITNVIANITGIENKIMFKCILAPKLIISELFFSLYIDGRQEVNNDNKIKLQLVARV